VFAAALTEGELAAMRDLLTVLKKIRVFGRLVEGDTSTSARGVVLLYDLRGELQRDITNLRLCGSARNLASCLVNALDNDMSSIWSEPSKMIAAGLLAPDGAIERVCSDQVIELSARMLIEDSLNDFDPCDFEDDVEYESDRRHRRLQDFREAARAGKFGAVDDVLAFYRTVARADMNDETLGPAIRLLRLMPNTIKAYLSMPTSSGCVERFFSGAGIVADGRAIGDERFEQETVMRAWIRGRYKTKHDMLKLIHDLTMRTFEIEEAATAAQAAPKTVKPAKKDNDDDDDDK
jgi:hypothetical protein